MFRNIKENKCPRSFLICGPHGYLGRDGGRVHRPAVTSALLLVSRNPGSSLSRLLACVKSDDWMETSRQSREAPKQR